MDVELGDGLVADAEGDADFEADVVGVTLVGGASRVGVADARLGVGLADRAAVVCGAVSTLVPGAVLLAGVVCTEAVVADPTLAGADGELVPPFDDGWAPETSNSTVTIAPTPHSAAAPIPAAARRRRPRGEPTIRSGYS